MGLLWRLAPLAPPQGPRGPLKGPRGPVEGPWGQSSCQRTPWPGPTCSAWPAVARAVTEAQANSLKWLNSMNSVIWVNSMNSVIWVNSMNSVIWVNSMNSVQSSEPISHEFSIQFSQSIHILCAKAWKHPAFGLGTWRQSGGMFRSPPVGRRVGLRGWFFVEVDVRDWPRRSKGVPGVEFGRKFRETEPKPFKVRRGPFKGPRDPLKGLKNYKKS